MTDSENETLPGEAEHYFVAKCSHIKHLRRAMNTGIWACRHRSHPPQPAEILTDALSKGKVILIFSVNKCHGWHGYATMATSPSTTENSDQDAQVVFEEDNSLESGIDWYRFNIKWEELFLKEHGEKCLPFFETSHLTLSDGSQLNKARNLQQLDADAGKKLCQAISKRIRLLSELKSAQVGEPFFCPTDVTNIGKTWDELVNRVESLGTVLLACCFGSHRYNVHTDSSDMDMFVVYAANTKDLLSLDKASHNTVTNKEGDVCDYAIYELSRYCELLLNGDPRCVETLFLHSSSLYLTHPKWRELLQWKLDFLTRQCIDKYVHDAVGSKGIKLLDKLTAGQTVTTMTPKVAKLSYIIIRLLQNARDVCRGVLHVFRDEGSADRQLLINVRSGCLDHRTVRDCISRLLQEIETDKGRVTQRMASIQLRREIDDWLIKLRYENLKTYMDTL